MSSNTKLKQKIREKIWRIMEERNIATFPRPVFGRIPNFVGAEKAAEKLRKTEEWRRSHVIFANPDSPQRPVRYLALFDGKKLYMASPRIKKGFILLDPEKIKRQNYRYATTIKGAFKYGKIISIDDMDYIEMKVTGCVAVDKKGGRLGKGHGYSDLEWGILSELGIVDRNTVTATTVHDIQIVDEIPMQDHDFPLDIIATPTQTIYTNTPYKKPLGIYWERIRERINEIPLLEYICKRKKIC